CGRIANRRSRGMALNSQVSFTWIGHGTWKARSAKGKEVLIDPWVMNNPGAPANMKKIDRCDVMLITHGHFDHIADAVEIAKATSGERHNRDAPVLPVGGFCTMGAERAAKAVSLLGVKTVVPMHFATFPALTGRPDQLQELVGGKAKVLDIKPGDTV